MLPMPTFEIQKGNNRIVFVLPEGNTMADYYCLEVIVNYEYCDRFINSRYLWGAITNGLFEHFRQEMISMYESMSGEAELSSPDGHLKLSMKDYGQISVELKDGMSGYNGLVHINFDIDQSYLPELIAQAGRILAGE